MHLARTVGGEAVERAAIRRMAFDAIVNATPVGMHPFVGEVAAGSRRIELQAGI